VCVYPGSLFFLLKENAMKFVVKSKEFRYGGRPLVAGAEFESQDTVEMRTLKALGHIAEAGAMPPPPKAAKRAVETRDLQASQAEQADPPTEQTPTKRTYRRRDLRAED
jgi:hypothetical protein